MRDSFCYVFKDIVDCTLGFLLFAFFVPQDTKIYKPQRKDLAENPRLLKQ